MLPQELSFLTKRGLTTAPKDLSTANSQKRVSIKPTPRPAGATVAANSNSAECTQPSDSFCGFFNIFQVIINVTSLCRERSTLHDESMVFSRYMIQAMTPFSLTKKVAVIFPSRLFHAFIKNYFQK